TIQRGTRPYEAPGPSNIEGAIEVDTKGAIKVQGSEDLCVSLTIPKGAMPAGGWPVLIYSHGTGGDYLSAFGQGLSRDYAQAGVEIGRRQVWRKKPAGIAGLGRTAFGDQSLATRMNPIIGLLDLLFGPADALPYADKVTANPPAGRGPTHLFHVYGVDDGVVP